MRDALPVRGIQGVQNLYGVLDNVPDWKRSFELRPLQILDHDVIRPNVINLTNVRMVQGGDSMRLALEALAELRGGDFDCDGSIEARIARLVDLAHPASADRRYDLVGAK